MPASPQFFVDEDDLGLGKKLDERIGGVVYPGHRKLPEVPRRTKDDEWLPIVGQKELVVITRDQHHRTRTVEMTLWQRHRVRGFVLSGKQSQSTDHSLTILLKYWAEIEEIIGQRPRGPWRYSITASRGITEQSFPPQDS